MIFSAFDFNFRIDSKTNASCSVTLNISGVMLVWLKAAGSPDAPDVLVLFDREKRCNDGTRPAGGAVGLQFYPINPSNIRVWRQTVHWTLSDSGVEHQPKLWVSSSSFSGYRLSERRSEQFLVFLAESIVKVKCIILLCNKQIFWHVLFSFYLFDLKGYILLSHLYDKHRNDFISVFSQVFFFNSFN